jgi:hypothetical protein
LGLSPYLRQAKKLGVTVSKTSVATVLFRHRLPPAPRRGSPSWTQFLAAQANRLLPRRYRVAEEGGRRRSGLLDPHGPDPLGLGGEPINLLCKIEQKDPDGFHVISGSIQLSNYVSCIVGEHEPQVNLRA